MIGVLYVLLTAICYLHYWQNDWGLVRVTNCGSTGDGTDTEIKAQKVNPLEERSSAASAGIEPATFRPRIRSCTAELFTTFSPAMCLDMDAAMQGGDVAQLVEQRSGTLPTLVRFPGAARLFFSRRVDFQCRLFYGVRTPPTPSVCNRPCIYICPYVKDPVVYVRVRWIMETLKTPSLHRRLGSATLSQLAFPGEGNPNFPWEKSHWDNTVFKSKVN